jgi:hypothetical protein
MLNTSDTVPRVFMMMVPCPNGTPVVKTLFHPQLYQSIPGVNTPWDDLFYALVTDLGPGNQIASVQFPADAFYLANEVRVLNIAAWQQLEQKIPMLPSAAFLR